MKTADGFDIVLNPRGKCNLGRDMYVVIWPDSIDGEYEVRTIPKPSIGPEGRVTWMSYGRESSHGKLNKHYLSPEGATRAILKHLSLERDRINTRIKQFEDQLTCHLGEGI